jgi:hypothetical protein
MKLTILTTLLIKLSLGLIYLTAGFSKLSPDYLGNIIGPVDLGKIYESSTIDVLLTLVAVYQILGGALILSQRYSVIGLVLVFPLALGTLIFTIIAGFAATPIINLCILLLLIYALLQEKKTVKQILKLNFKSITSSITFQNFPNKFLSNIALGLTILTTCLTFLNNPILNILLTFSLLIFTINLFQVKNYLLIDKIILILFFIIGLIIINGILLNQIIPKVFYSVFALIPLGILLYLIRLFYWIFSKKAIKT